MVENMEGKSTNGNNEQSAETSLSTTNGQRTLTPEMSSLITSVNQLAMKLGREPGNDFGKDKSLEFGNLVLN